MDILRHTLFVFHFDMVYCLDILITPIMFNFLVDILTKVGNLQISNDHLLDFNCRA